MNPLLLLFSFFAGLALTVYPCAAQTPDAFNPAPNGATIALSIQNDGKAIIGGSFTSVAGIPRNRIARLNIDGGIDSAFNPNANSFVWTTAVQNDGKILIGGGFTNVGGVALNFFARLLPDGAVDTSFFPEPNAQVYSTAIQPDGKILIAGFFSTVAGVPRNFVARLNPDGSLDGAFNPGANSYVSALALQPDGKILICGSFTTVSGVARNHIARLNPDGTLDTSFNPNANSPVYAMAVQSDGKILIGGGFSNIGGITRNHFAQLESDGTLSPSFDINANGPVVSISALTDGKVLIGGEFTNIGGVARGRLARIHSSGTLDLGFNPNANGVVYFVSPLSDGKMLMGGEFSAVSGQSRPFLARVTNNDGAAQSIVVTGTDQIDWLRTGSLPEVEQVTFDVWNGSTWIPEGIPDRVTGGWRLSGLSLPATSLVRARGFKTTGFQNGGSSIVEQIATYGGGSFPDIALSVDAGPSLISGTASVNFGNLPKNVTSPAKSFTITNTGDAILDSFSIVPTGGNAANFSVSPLGGSQIAPGDSLTFTVTFTPSEIGLRGTYLAISNNDADENPFTIALEGTGNFIDPSFTPDTNGTVKATAIEPDGRMLIAGDFTTVNGVTRRSLARLRADGSLDLSFNPNVDASVEALVVQPDGGILIGGSFANVGSVARSRIARLNPDGTLDSAFSPSTDAAVLTLVTQTDGKILLGGSFTQVNGQPRTSLARLNPDGTLDLTVDSIIDAAVQSIALQPDGKIVIGGSFTSVSGTPRNSIARLQPDGSLDTPFDPNITGSVRSLALQPDGALLIAGQFSAIGGVLRNSIARLAPDSTLDIDYNPDANGEVSSLTLLADGKSLAAGSFTTLGGIARSFLARINLDGSLDSSFTPLPDAEVTSLAVFTDGSILAGGAFSTVDGLPAKSIVRLANTLTATQSFSIPGPNQIDWLRSGAAPELQKVTFEAWNGTTWLPLNTPTRITGGWRATDLSLTENTWLRARGTAIGGSNNSSSGIIEHKTIYVSGNLPNLGVSVNNGPNLISSQAVIDFGSVPQGSSSTTKTISLTNIGTAPLTSLSVSKQGANASEFLFSALPTTTLAPGASTTFTVTFNPTQSGPHGASLNITSNDGDENPFLLALIGTSTFIDSAFDPQANGIVSAIALQPDGKTLLGGGFTLLSGQARASLARLTQEGTLDASFAPQVNGPVHAIAVQPDGKILIAGLFTTVNSTTRLSLARLHPDSTLDLSFNPAANASVTALTLAPDGKILLGGEFTTISATPRNHIARLNPDGTLDLSFDPDADGIVHTIALSPDGKILLGGNFATLSGQARQNIARLDATGTLDLSFTPGADGTIRTLAFEDDGKILLGGNFTNVAGSPRTHLARLLPDGNLDSSFTPTANAPILSLALQADGKILLGGEFTTLGAATRNFLARLLPDGQIDPAFASTPDHHVHALTLQADGKILLGGAFTALDGISRTRIARITNTHPASQALVITAPAQIEWLRAGSTAEIEQPTFEQWDGTAWITLTTPTRIPGGWRSSGLSLPPSTWIRARGKTAGGSNNGSSGIIQQITSYGSGTFPDLLVSIDGGPNLTTASAPLAFPDQPINSSSTTKTITLTNAGDAPLTNLAHTITGLHSSQFAVTPLSTTSLAPGASTTFTIAFAPTTLGLLAANLELTSNDADESPFTFALTGTSTFADPTFMPQVNGTIDALTLQADGKILLGGEFTNVANIPRNHLARLNPDGTLDLNFSPTTNAHVESIAIQPNGQILVGGGFSIVNGITRSAMALLNSDGTLVSSFTPSVNAPVTCIALQPDGKILIGGGFTTVGGITRNSIARLEPDGSLDLTFDPAPNASVRSLALQPDGKILVSGNFTTLAGSPRNFIARLQPDGSLDTAFDPQANASVAALTLQPDGAIIIAGNFTEIASTSRNRIARLHSDGSLDPTFNPDSNDSIFTLALQADGKILVAGAFTTIGGMSRSHIALLDSSGLIVPAFDLQADQSIRAIALQTDGQILTAGSFTTLGGVPRQHLARTPHLTPATQSLTVTGTTQIDWLRSGSGPEISQVHFEVWDGTQWTTLGNASRIAGGWQMLGLSLPASSWVRAYGRTSDAYQNGSSGIVLQSTTYGTADFPDIAISIDAGPALTPSSGPVNFLNQTLSIPSSAKTLTLTNTGTAPLTGLAIANTGTHSADFTVGSLPLTTLPPGDSTTVSITFTPFAIGQRQTSLSITSNDADETPFTLDLIGNGTFVDSAFTPTTNGVIYSIAVQPDGKTLLAGNFTLINGQPRNRLARLHADGTLDSSFAPEPNAPVFSIGLQADGRILIGGFFTSVGGITRNYLARLNPDGNLDTSFNPAPNNFVSALTQQPDGKILIGGQFTSISNQTRNAIARLNPDGTLDANFNPNASGPVNSLALQPDGKILLGGDFTSILGVTRNRIARLNATGTLDTTFNPNANGYVSTLALQPDGKILLGGGFTVVRGSTRNRIARLNTNGTLDSTFNPNASAAVFCVALQTDGKILLGGDFTSIGAIPRSRLARLNASGNLDLTHAASADATVHALTLLPTGKVLAGGAFANAGGLPRQTLAQFPNDLASQALSVTGTTQIDWLRSGAACELEQVTFDSWNGSSWISHGNATRIPGAWQKTGLSLPATTWVRARGKIIGGTTNGNSGIVEHIISYGSGSLPDIQVTLPSGPPLVSGTATVDFLGQPKNTTSPAQTFTITNTGTTTLSSLSLVKSGPHSGNFTLGNLAVTSLAPGNSTDFTVAFTPSEIGLRNASLSILSNDADETPFTITLTGSGYESPEIRLEQPVPTEQPSGTTYDFGLAALNSSIPRVFTLRNTGPATLVLGTPTITGTHAPDFALTATVTSIPPHSQATLLVRFIPSAPGTRQATLHLPNNDSDESAFTLNLTGTGNSPPTFSGFAFSTDYQTPASIPLVSILANAIDPDGHTVSITAVGPTTLAGGTAILGINSILYTPPNGASGADSFSITFTDSLGANHTDVITATILLDPSLGSAPPTISILPNGDVSIIYEGIPNQSYPIQRSIDLLDWQPLTTLNASPTGTLTFTDTSPPPGKAFYRILKPQ